MRFKGMGTMCKIVDDLGHVFDAEMGRVLSDSGIVGVMNKQGMCDNHNIRDSVNNGGEWSEIAENEGGQCE